VASFGTRPHEADSYGQHRQPTVVELLPACSGGISPKNAGSRIGLVRVARSAGSHERCAGGMRCQMPAYHAYPPSGDAEPKPLPNRFRLSVRVRLVMYLTFL